MQCIKINMMVNVMIRSILLCLFAAEYWKSVSAADIHQETDQIPKDEGISPMKVGMKRSEENSTVPLSTLILLPGGVFWMGSQIAYKGKIAPAQTVDGAGPRKRARVKRFYIQEDCITNAQFQEFVKSTGYKSESELFQWSFVIENQASKKIRKEVDGPKGMGRVKSSKHWMAVRGASWQHPYGLDSSIDSITNLPAVHISFTDATEYCAWAGMRLPTEKEWEYAARGGRVNQSYPWGDIYEERRMNIWDGPDFPKTNLLIDGYLGPAPVKSFPANDFDLYNLLGNVWEWVAGGTPEKRILRGGSFIDSKDGKYNHIVMVSTRQTNSGDSAASNIGFRCAKTYSDSEHSEL